VIGSLPDWQLLSLEPIDPETALELYIADRENELTEATIYSHRSRLGHFVRWCDEQGIGNLNDLTGRQLHRYRLWRRDEGDLSLASEKTQMDTLRVFVRWLEQVDGAEQDLSTKVRSPSLTPEQNTRDVMLDSEQATSVLAHLEKYEYATLGHVTIAILWHTMMRVGAAHALTSTTTTQTSSTSMSVIAQTKERRSRTRRMGSDS